MSEQTKPIKVNEEKNPSGASKGSPLPAQVEGATPRPNYAVTIVIGDDGSWPRIAAENLCSHIGIKLPSGLSIESMKASANTRTDSAKAKVEALTKAAWDLCGFLNVTPLRLNEGDSMTLSMLTDAMRAALIESPDTKKGNI